MSPTQALFGDRSPSDGYLGACGLPSLSGLVLFGAIGALISGNGWRRRFSGAVDGVFGAWVGCAAGNALGASGRPAGAALTVGGAVALPLLWRGAQSEASGPRRRRGSRKRR